MAWLALPPKNKINIHNYNNTNGKYNALGLISYYYYKKLFFFLL